MRKRAEVFTQPRSGVRIAGTTPRGHICDTREAAPSFRARLAQTGSAHHRPAHNVVLVGGHGTGKTHLATAIGVQAIEHHRKRVRFFSTVELVNALEQEKLQGKPLDRSRRASPTPTSSSSMKSCDDLPSSASGGALLFHLLSKLYERTKLPPSRPTSSFGEWATVFGDPNTTSCSPLSPHSPLPHSRNRKRQLPLQEQLREFLQAHQGEISFLHARSP